MYAGADDAFGPRSHEKLYEVSCEISTTIVGDSGHSSRGSRIAVGAVTPAGDEAAAFVLEVWQKLKGTISEILRLPCTVVLVVV